LITLRWLSPIAFHKDKPGVKDIRMNIEVSVTDALVSIASI